MERQAAWGLVTASTSKLEVKRGSGNSGDLFKFTWLVTWPSWRVNSGHLFHHGAYVSGVQTWKVPLLQDGQRECFLVCKGGSKKEKSPRSGALELALEKQRDR